MYFYILCAYDLFHILLPFWLISVPWNVCTIFVHTYELNICMYILWMYICVYVCTYIYTYTHMRVCVCVCVYLCIYICTYTYVQICVRVYVYTHLRMYVRALWRHRLLLLPIKAIKRSGVHLNIFSTNTKLQPYCWLCLYRTDYSRIGVQVWHCRAGERKKSWKTKEKVVGRIESNLWKWRWWW